jgi:hypothetical protein
MNQFYYSIEYSITNRYDLNPLRVVGHTKCFADVDLTQQFTEIPFSELGVDLSYQDVKASTKDEITANIEAVVLPLMEAENVQAKLQEAYEIYTLGL